MFTSPHLHRNRKRWSSLLGQPPWLTTLSYLGPCGGEDEHLLHAVDLLHGLVHDALEVERLPAPLALVSGEHPLAVCVL